MIAGPSEVLVVADGGNDPDWIAADLLAQAEHDTAAQSILITDDAELADAVEAAVERQLRALPRGETARASWRDFGAIIVVASLAEAPPLSNRIAPEHLELAVADPEALLPQIRNAGVDLPRPRTRRRRSATMSAGRTTCCRRRARRASPPASPCSTS